MRNPIRAFMQGVTKLYDTSTGKDVYQKATEGAGHVRPLPGPAGVSHVRELIAVNKPATSNAVVVAGDLHTATWATGENITEVTVTATHGAAATTNYTSTTGEQWPTNGIYIVFDAVSDAVAAVWLQEGATGDRSTQSYRYFIPLNTPRTFYFNGNITRADCMASFHSADNDFDVILEGA